MKNMQYIGQAGQDRPGVLERFSEPDQNYGVPAVPVLATQAQPQLIPLKGVDLIDSFDVRFLFSTTWNAFTTAANLIASPMWPYNMVRRLTIPYQTGNINVIDLDGHMAWLYSVLRQNNRQYNAIPLLQQAPIQTTLYDPQANLVSGTLDTTPSASTAYTYPFQLSVPVALWFDQFFDQVMDEKNVMRPVRIDDVFVSPFLMASTGRNAIPSIVLNPVLGTTYDNAGFIYTGSGTTPTWTDGGSKVWFRRNGWRQPSNMGAMPPLFNWAHTINQQRFILPNNQVSIPLPPNGQLLSVVGRMWDPTLGSGVGGFIDLSNLTSLGISYGSGINKFQDAPAEHQERIWQQHGFNVTKGTLIYDMYADKRSNLDAINTYNTAGVQLNLDFGSNTPGAGSYIDLGLEYLTLVQS